MAKPKDTTPLSLTDVTKMYGTFKGIDSVSFDLKEGEVFGFLGPNGAGKTTAIRTIMDFLHPTSGAIGVFGLDSVKDSVEIKRRVGYVAGDFELYDNLTGKQYLEFVSNLRTAKGAQAVIAALSEKLEANLHKRIGLLSRGNMQKIALIAALLHDPDLLILDEPTTGLDPLMQNHFYDIIRERTQRGKTVFMSSHILSEVQEVCDRVGFMRAGKLVKIIDVDEFKKDHKKEISLKLKSSKKTLLTVPFKDAEILMQTKDQLRFTTAAETIELLAWLCKQSITDIAIQDVSLDDIFLKLYGQEGEA